MIVFCIIISFTLGVLAGAKVYKIMIESELKKENDKLIKNINNQFEQILKNLVTGTSRFKSRINTTVHIESTLSEHGNIDIIYLMDKNDIAIFQDTKCLYTSEKVEKSVIKSITDAIDLLYQKEISEVVDFFGIVLSKKEFERQFKMDIDEINNLVKNVKIVNNNDLSELEKIIDDNKTKYDVDEILDKISKYGIEILTPEEKNFLDNLGNQNEKRN
jgi:hypothetical protein